MQPFKLQNSMKPDCGCAILYRLMGIETSIYLKRPFAYQEGYLALIISPQIICFWRKRYVLYKTISIPFIILIINFLQTELGLRLLPSFKTASGVPYSDVNLNTRKGHPPKWNADSTTSEVTTIQLEFRDLSRVTGNPSFEVISFFFYFLLNSFQV